MNKRVLDSAKRLLAIGAYCIGWHRQTDPAVVIQVCVQAPIRLISTTLRRVVWLYSMCVLLVVALVDDANRRRLPIRAALLSS